MARRAIRRALLVVDGISGIDDVAGVVTGRSFAGRVALDSGADRCLPLCIAAGVACRHRSERARSPVELARATNGYIDATAPFKLRKEPDKAKRLDTVLHRAAQAIKNALVGLLPVLPEKAAAGLRQLGLDPGGRSFIDLLNTPLAAGHKLGEGVPLFPKVETTK